MLRRIFRRDKHPTPHEQLQAAVRSLPQHTVVAMLEALDSDLIIVGAYTDSKWGGVCPLLAAHRRGGRPDHATFASAWDRFTGAVGHPPRPAFRSELRALRHELEAALLETRERDRARRELLAEARASRPWGEGLVTPPAPATATAA
jgi:hypothetical protein